MQIRRWRIKRIIIIIMLSISIGSLFFGGLILHKKVDNMKCSEEESKHMIRSLCELYAEGRVGGNLCHDICIANRMIYKKCLNYREGKKILVMDWRHWTVILKSEKAYLKDFFKTEYQDFTKNLLQMNGAQTLDSMVKQMIKFNLGYGNEIENATDILTDMWSLDFYDFVKHSGTKHAMHAATESLWSLIQQEEYVTMKFYQDYDHFPKIYGTCGHFYAMEFAPPGQYLDSSLSQDLVLGNHWHERAKTALGILDLVRSFDMDLHQPLHMCDTKGENFGLTPDLQVKAIDTDMVFFESKLYIEFQYTNCTQHSECDYFDCKGWCDFKSKTCTKKRINNNLQIICEQIFLPYASNSWLGLLRAPPPLISDRLKIILVECATLTGEEDQQMLKKKTETNYWRLHTLLKQTVDFEFDPV